MTENTKETIKKILSVENLDKTFMDFYLKIRRPFDRSGINVGVETIGLICAMYEMHIEIVKITNDIKKLKIVNPKAKPAEKPKSEEPAEKPIAESDGLVKVIPFAKVTKAIDWNKVLTETIVHCQVDKDGPWLEGKMIAPCKGNLANKCLISVIGLGEKEIIKKQIRISNDTFKEITKE